MPPIFQFPRDQKKIANLAGRKSRRIFFAASIKISPARFRELGKLIPRGYRPVFGFYRDKKIHQLGGAVLQAQTTWRGFKFPARATIVRYTEADGPALIRALRSDKLVFVRGSWATALYFRDEWHQSFRANRKLKVSDIAMVSPFTRAEAQRLPGYRPGAARVGRRRATAFDRLMVKRVAGLAAQSLCWIYQRGAVIVRGQKILVEAFNRVWPYPAYCLHQGCVRENEMIPSGAQLERCFTSHSEMGVIATAAARGIKLKGGVMYTTTFPCINCAKVIANSGLKEIIFWKDYASRSGELVLSGAGVRMTKLKI